MNILETKDKNKFDGQLRTIVKNLGWEGRVPDIAGSASLASQKYYSDYDLFLDVSKEKLNSNQVYKKLEDILKQILANPNLYFMELKMELLNGNKIRWFYGDKFDKDKFDKDFNKVKFIKLDLIARLSNIFTEISIIYNFKQAKENIFESFKNDIEDLQKEGKFYKILKRVFSINRIKKNYPILKLITDFFNSDIGAKYQLLSNLSTINSLLDVYSDDDTKKKIELNLVELGLDKSIKSIPNLIKKLTKEINEEAKDFIKKNNIKI